jgi:ribonuclease BN (tRNA processing enzyme)
LKITILGTGAAYSGLGDAGSGFLVQEGKTNLLIDCGTGVLSNLQRHIDLANITDIVISHMHADHFFDLIPYRYALRYGLEVPDAARPRLHLPPDGDGVLSQLVSYFAESDTFFSDVFDVSEYDIQGGVRLGNLSVQFIAVQHYIPTYGITITNTKKLAYSSDSGLCEGLLEIARDADLFICHIGACLENGKIAKWGHLTPEQAGEVASQAGVKRLLLSHLWPACNRAQSLERASRCFSGAVELAEASHSFEL